MRAVDSESRSNLAARRLAMVMIGLLFGSGCGKGHNPQSEVRKTLSVQPGESIQKALDQAAADPDCSHIIVHAGTYSPSERGEALIWFNAKHDGLRLEAQGEVILTAANPELADKSAPTFPAIVNHVVFFGDGITNDTVLTGFKITGARGYRCPPSCKEVEPDRGIPKGRFYYTDGGGIKIFGRSYPTIENIDVVDNYAQPCGGGVSVEHRGFMKSAVRFRNCRFLNNRCQITGSAVDLLPGSRAQFENCLLVGNLSNLGLDDVGLDGKPYNEANGSGALTVFPRSKAEVRHCTFAGNWNGVDDKGEDSTYESCIFANNHLAGGTSKGSRYEMDILNSNGVKKCVFHGKTVDLRGTIDASQNTLSAPDPEFDSRYVPSVPAYRNAGYRPSSD